MKRVLFIVFLLILCFMSACGSDAPLNDNSYNVYQIDGTIKLGDEKPASIICFNGDIYCLQKETGGMQLVQYTKGDISPMMLADDLPWNCLLSTQKDGPLLFVPEENNWSVYNISNKNLDKIHSITAPTNTKIIDFRMSDATLYAATKDRLYLCSSDTAYEIASPEEAPIANFAVLSQGDVVAQLAPANRVEPWESFQVLSIENNQLVPLERTAANEKPMINGQVVNGDTYDLYSYQNDFIYGIDFKHKTTVPLVSKMDFGEGQNVLSFWPDGEQGFAALLVNQNTEEYSVVFLTKTEIRRQIVELAVVGSVNRFLDKAIISFNHSSDLYTIQVTYFEADQRYSALKIALATGDAPDLLSVYGSDYSMFVQQGMLADLMVQQESDNSVPVNDLNLNILEQLQDQNALYYIYPEFQLKTVVQDAAEMATISELLAMKRENPTLPVFYGISQTEILELLLKSNLKSFVDYESDSCSFDCLAFRELLELAKTGLGEMDSNSKPIISVHNINGIRDFQRIRGTVGNACIGGIPCTGEGQPLISGLYSLAMCENGKNRPGAVAFLSYVLGSDYQTNVEYMPVCQSVFDARIEQAKEEETISVEQFEDAFAAAAGNNINGIHTELHYEGITQEEINEFKTLLSFAQNSVNPYYEDLLDIIMDEFRSYCNDTCSVITTSENIQKRAIILLSEVS